MADTVVGVVRVDAEVGTAGVAAGISDAQGQLNKFGKSLQNLGDGITKTGLVMTAGLTAPFLALVKESMGAAQESRAALGQVEAAQQSMGHAAGRTTEQLQAQATALMGLSTFDDDDILRKVTANMLTFGKVTGTAFDRAQQAAVDLSARLGNDLQSSAIMVGKALNDPIKGITALTRVGVSFTAAQKEQVKAMVAAGDTAGAQNLILTELQKQYGGAAKALQDATPGDDLKDSWATFQEVIGGFALDILPKLTTPLAAVIDKFNAMPEPLQQTAVTVAALGAALGPVMLGLGPIISGIGALVPLIGTMGAAIGTAATAAGGFLPLLAPLIPVIAAVAAAAGAAYLVWQNWGTIAPMLESFGQSIMAAIGPAVLNALDALKGAAMAFWNSEFVANVTTLAKAVGTFGGIVLSALGPSLLSVLKAAGAVFAGALNIIADAVRLVVALLSGDWAGAWNAAKGIVSSAATAIAGLLRNLGEAAVGFVSRMVQGIDHWMGGALSAIWNKVKAGIDQVKGWFFGLYDAVVGHSYIPDMVDGIAATMARLDGAMVQPAKKATAATGEAFRKLADEAGALLDRLFPEAAAWNTYQAELATIDKALKAHILTVDQAAEARRRLAMEGMTTAPVDVANTPAIEVPIPDLGDYVNKGLPDLQKATENTTSKMVESFANMARDVTASLRGMVANFKKGDILGGITGLLDIVGQVAGIIGGFKGGGVKASPAVFTRSATPGFATGGSFTVGGSPGTDTNLVQFRATKGEMVNITRPGDQAAAGGPYFDLRGAVMTADLLDQMNRIGDQAAVRGAAGGAALATQRSRRAAKHSLG